MSKINVFILLILVSVSLLISGCYTIVGYPSELGERYIEDEALVERTYNYREYYYNYPYSYFWNYYEPYYDFIYPFSNYYWNSPWWHNYDNYNYRSYDQYYVPNVKPETKSRLEKTHSGTGSRVKENRKN